MVQCDVLIAIPHSGLSVNLEWAVTFASLWKHAPPHTKLFLMPEPQIDVARNKAVAAALQVGAKHVFFLDSDIHPPNDAISRLLSRKLPIVSGLYGRRQNPPRNQMLRRQGGVLIPIEEGMYEPGSLVECDAIGLGCVLVEAEALRKIGAPWFQWTESYVMGGESEDFEFCRKAKEADFKVFVDTGLICRHSGLIKWLPPSKNGNVFEYSQTTGMFSD
jgi:glycosyltransferase involved in cell wall biosynthesis